MYDDTTIPAIDHTFSSRRPIRPDLDARRLLPRRSIPLSSTPRPLTLPPPKEPVVDAAFQDRNVLVPNLVWYYSNWVPRRLRLGIIVCGAVSSSDLRC